MNDSDLKALDALLQERHSCRAFLPDQVPRSDIERILETAGRTPSWCNAQPWSLVITSGAETDRFRDRLKAAASDPDHPARADFDWPTGYSGAYQARRRETGWQLYSAVGVQKGDFEGAARQSARNFDLFDAPHVAILHVPAELGAYAAVDAGGFVTVFCLAATASGIATIPQAAVAAYADLIRDHFRLGEDRRIVCAISFGYSDKDHDANSFRTSRAGVGEIAEFIG